MSLRPTLVLCVDSGAGLAVGVGVMMLVPWLAELYALPVTVIAGMGIANLLYGSYSGALVAILARRGTIERRWVTALVLGNLAWMITCFTLLVAHRDRVSVIGVLLLVIEALFVGGLALVEWKYVRPSTIVAR